MLLRCHWVKHVFYTARYRARALKIVYSSIYYSKDLYQRVLNGKVSQAGMNRGFRLKDDEMDASILSGVMHLHTSIQNGRVT